MLLLSLVAGWTHEALTVPVSLALLYWLFRHRKGMLRHPTTYYIMAYLAGVMMLLLSPALWHRADENGIGLQQRLVYGMFNLVLNVRITWLLLATLAIQLYRGKDVLAASLRANRYILTAWVAAVGIVIVCGENLVRVAIYADFLAMLAILKIWQGEWLRRHQTAVVTLCMVACVTIAIPAIALNMENRENYLYHCQQFEEPGKQVIKIRQTFNGSNMADQWLRKRYVLPNIEFGFALYNMPFDSHDYDTRAVAWLFNKDDIVMLPEDVVDKIEADSNAYVQWEADSNETLYIWQLQPPRKVSRVVFELGDEIALPFYMRWTTYPGHEYELDSMKHEVVTLRDNSYLVMTIPMNKIKRRIKAIRIEP